MKRILLILFTLLLLAGCSANESTNSETVLWVITEQSASDGMNYQAEQAAKTFEAEYEKITVRIDVLPTNEEERDIYLQQLRTQIMAGDGPDVYLLPTGSDLIIDSQESGDTTTISVEPLFHDVEQTMRLGVFADLQSFYGEDDELNTAQLQQEIIDAGIVDGKRYVLPIRYTMPVLLANTNADSVSMVEPGTSAMTDLVSYALVTEDRTMATGLLMPTDTSIFPTLYDYTKGEILVSVEELTEYMRLYQQWYSTADESQKQMIEIAESENEAFYNEEFHYVFDDILGELNITISMESFNSVKDYVLCDTNWTTSELPFYTTSMSGALENAFLKEAMQAKVEMYPLRRMDGSVGAEVTYFGAVGASCENLELAYDYLRLFLTEDYQWDTIRPRRNQSDGLIENSWPVRTIGATSSLFNTLEYQLTNVSAGITRHKERLNQIRAGVSEITDADMPVLQVEIDEVRFPFYQPYEESLSYALTLLNNEDGTPTDVDIDELAEQVYQYLWWHLAEG